MAAITGDWNKEQLEAFLDHALLARLATADKRTAKPHVAPVWFLWDGEYLWVSTFAAARKIRNLENNPSCAVTVDWTEGGLRYKGVIFEGQVEIIREPWEFIQEMTKKIYTRYLGEEGVLAPTPTKWRTEPSTVLIRLTPAVIKTWDMTRRAIAPLP